MKKMWGALRVFVHFVGWGRSWGTPGRGKPIREPASAPSTSSMWMYRELALTERRCQMVEDDDEMFYVEWQEVLVWGATDEDRANAYLAYLRASAVGA